LRELGIRLPAIAHEIPETFLVRTSISTFMPRLFRITITTKISDGVVNIQIQ
jgi:hypothetical protein